MKGSALLDIKYEVNCQNSPCYSVISTQTISFNDFVSFRPHSNDGVSIVLIMPLWPEKPVASRFTMMLVVTEM